jgi:hypothetical protein
MLSMSLNLIPYHGWQLEILREEANFRFRCYHPVLPDYCDDGYVYSSVEQALAAACDFVDREIAIKALFDIAEGWLVTGKITDVEYWQLTDFE